MSAIPTFVWYLVGLALFLGISAAIIYPLSKAGIKIVYEFETGVVFTLGRFSGLKKPGIRFLIPILQRMWKVDMRTVSVEIPKQEVLTRDNINLYIEAVVYYRVQDPETALVKVLDFNENTKSKAQAVIRDVIGSRTLDEVLQQRAELQAGIKDSVEAVVRQWGVEVEDILLQQIELPPEMRRSMAAEAEAERERRASIITSRGEVQAAANLLKAAAIMAGQPGALYLKTLQAMQSMAADPAQKIVMLLPTDASGFGRLIGLSDTLDVGSVRETMAQADAHVKSIETQFGEDVDGDGKVG